jgi:predicted ATPase
LTVLTGLNSTGKSTVIQAMLLLRQSYHDTLLPNVGLSLSGEFVEVGTAKDALFEGAKEESISFELEFSDDVAGRFSFRYNEANDVLDLSSEAVGPEVFKQSLFVDRFQYLEAERVGPRASFEMSDYYVRRHGQLGANGEYTAHYLAQFSAKQTVGPELRHQHATSSTLRDQVEAWMGEISPGLRLHFTAHPGMDLMHLRYSYNAPGQVASNEYRPTNVGFGITYSLPVVVALLSAPKDAIVLLENPEAHLHPRGQVKIGELLARAAASGVQVVVESHSDHVLNGIRLAVHEGILDPTVNLELHYFDREGGPGTARSRVVSPRMDSQGRIDSWPDGFFDEFEKSLEQLI